MLYYYVLLIQFHIIININKIILYIIKLFVFKRCIFHKFVVGKEKT